MLPSRSRECIIASAFFILITGSLAVGQQTRPVDREEPMSYLDNGIIRLGCDLRVGGAITWLSQSGPAQRQPNLVNSWDFGRQIQMSYYSGPVPFAPEGKQPDPHWRELGWNPIQVGDAFHHASRIVEHRNDGKEIYVKCVPMQWPLDNVPGECTFECWFTLEGAAVHAHSRLNNARADHTQYSGRGQELPAIYTNGPWYRLMTYRGDKPFSGDKLSRIEKTAGEFWSSWIATESWAALVDDHDFGLGVWEPGCCSFIGGFAGQPGAGGPHDNPTGYIAPTPRLILDWNIQHDYRYDLIVGSLPEIRKYVYDRAASPAPPVWRFEHDRGGWSYVNATDTGWPIRGELNVLLEENDPQLHGPVGFWPAGQFATLVVEAASHTTGTGAQLFWRRLGESEFSDDQVANFPIVSDGAFHAYRIKLADNPRWKGPIVQLRFDPVETGAKGEWIRIKSIALEK